MMIQMPNLTQNAVNVKVGMTDTLEVAWDKIFEVKVFVFDTMPVIILASIWCPSMLFQRNCITLTIKWINLWIHKLIHLFHIFLIGPIFFLHFYTSLQQIFTSHGSLWCCLSYQSYHFFNIFLWKISQTPLIQMS